MKIVHFVIVHVRRIVLSVFCLSFLAGVETVLASPYLYDMGTRNSDVWEGFERVTQNTLYSEESGFGWKSEDGLKATRDVLRKGEGKGKKSEDPPILTNAITEDQVIGTEENSFLVKLPAGDYQVLLICGRTSGYRSQILDFDVRVGSETRRVQIEGRNYFVPLEFTTHHDGKQAFEVKFSPRNLFQVNAILLWPTSERVQVNEEILEPLKQWICLMSPDEWAKWTEISSPLEEPPSLSESDQRRGFVTYTRPYVEPIYPHTAPKADELNPELRAFASPGEYEPLTVAVYPLRNFASIQVRVSDLGPISTKNIDVRHVRYMRARPERERRYLWSWVPDVLEHFDSVPLKKAQSERFWLTVRVPENTPPGNYSGTITLSRDEQAEIVVPVSFRVLPIRLQEDPSKIFGIYYHHSLDQVHRAPEEVSKAYYRRRAELETLDMVNHGIRNVICRIPCPPADAEGKFEIDWAYMEDVIALWKKRDFGGPIVVKVDSEAVYQKYMGKFPGTHLIGVRDPVPEFETEITAMIRAIEAGRKERGFPEFIYYPYDEPNVHPEAIAYLEKALRGCKAAGVRTYVTGDSGLDQFKSLLPLVDVWCSQTFTPNRETVLADGKARGVEYWCYPNPISVANDHTPTSGARMTFGFGFWRSGFRALVPWTYSADTADPFNYLDGDIMDILNRHEPDGTPIPVALWECFREGYDDCRYIYTLEQKIAEAKRSDQKDVRMRAEEAQAELDYVWNEIQVQPKYKYTGLWPSGSYDLYRWIIARQIIRLDEALK